MRTINIVRNFLTSPHPYYYRPGNIYTIALLLSFSAFLFLYFFEPFQINFTEHNYPFFVNCLLQSALPGSIFLVYFLILYTARKKPVEKGWTMGRELMHLLFVLLLMGTGNFFLRPILYDNPDNWSVHYYVEEVGNAYLVGLLFILIFMPLNHFRLKAKNEKLSAQFNADTPEKTDQQVLHCMIETQLKSEDFLLSINDFIYARAEGNYVMFYILNEKTVGNYLKRMTLSHLENQLKAYPKMLRTHRAYLVNLQQVEHVSGNAQGLQLTVKSCSDRIPVSRAKISDFRKKFYS